MYNKCGPVKFKWTPHTNTWSLQIIKMTQDFLLSFVTIEAAMSNLWMWYLLMLEVKCVNISCSSEGAGPDLTR